MNKTVHIHIDLQPVLFRFLQENKNLFQRADLSYKPQTWRKEVYEQFVDRERFERLYGGFRNLVVREKGGTLVRTYWRESAVRWMTIIKACLLEHTVAGELGVAGRTLVDSQKPVKITNEGLFITDWNYVEGENRYPWNEKEIASGALLLSKLHQAMRRVSFGVLEPKASSENQWIHGDAARGNVLFSGESAVAVIDYENAEIGDYRQDVGRTLSYLLVDAKVKYGQDPKLRDEFEQLVPVFEKRTNALYESYKKPDGEVLDSEDKKVVAKYAAVYLMHEDYGGLNLVRSMAFDWMWNEWGFNQQDLVSFDIEGTSEISSTTVAFFGLFFGLLLYYFFKVIKHQSLANE